ncbi:MAG: hydrogenase iron-sulfur subunit [Candidatus Bathyarchaeota archaeon]|nr:MAG: hydrogenase iron-sulfur subunit [Candidatus Bathyarchaeota archaeon]
MAPTEEFEPRILGFLCNWCSYAGADLAGVSRFQYPTNVRIIRVMCSGRVDPTLVFEGFINGMDGVMVLGCHPGDCHYLTGNYYAERRMKSVKSILEYIGVEPDRLLLDWVSAAEGERYAAMVKGFTEKIRGLGPLDKEKPVEELMQKLIAAREAFAQHRTRWLVGKEKEMVEEGNVFGDKVSQEEFDKVMIGSLRKEYVTNRILLSVKDDALSAREIANRLGVPSKDVVRSLINLERDGSVAVAEVSDSSPKYRRI